MRESGSRTLKIAIAAVVVLAAAGVLLWLGTGRGATYYYSVSELKALSVAEHVRVSGRLQDGSLARGDSTRFTFTIYDRDDPSSKLQVTYEGALPDAFKDKPDSEVVLEGERLADGTFLATTLIAKCPSKYEAAQ